MDILKDECRWGGIDEGLSKEGMKRESHTVGELVYITQRCSTNVIYSRYIFIGSSLLPMKQTRARKYDPKAFRYAFHFFFPSRLFHPVEFFMRAIPPTLGEYRAKACDNEREMSRTRVGFVSGISMTQANTPPPFTLALHFLSRSVCDENRTRTLRNPKEIFITVIRKL